MAFERNILKIKQNRKKAAKKRHGIYSTYSRLKRANKIPSTNSPWPGSRNGVKKKKKT